METEYSNGATNGVVENKNVINLDDYENSISVDDEICFYCRKKATKVCQYCKTTFYCSDEHGKIHRPDDVCFPFKIEYLPHVGNYMVASRDIEPAGTYLSNKKKYHLKIINLKIKSHSKNMKIQ